MSEKWPQVKLGEVLTRIKDQVTVKDDQNYMRLTIRLNGKGIVQRDHIAGREIGTKKQFVARAGQLILSKIDARNGAFGILPNECDNAIITGNFWTFDADNDRLFVPYFDYLTRTPLFVDFCVRASEGTTNRRYLQEDKFLAQEIELPPLQEQRRVVARIEELNGKIREVRDLRRHEELELSQMLLGAFHRLTEDAPRRRMRDVAPLIRRPVAPDPLASYKELGIRSFGKGTFHKPSLTGAEIGEKRVFQIEPGDLLFSNVFAWEGAIAVAKPDDVGRIGSHRFISSLPKPHVATSPFLCFFFLTRDGLDLIRAASPGGALRNRTLGLAALENISVPVPHIDDQRWFDSLQAEVTLLKQEQAKSNIELDALLPSILLRAYGGDL